MLLLLIRCLYRCIWNLSPNMRIWSLKGERGLQVYIHLTVQFQNETRVTLPGCALLIEYLNCLHAPAHAVQACVWQRAFGAASSGRQRRQRSRALVLRPARAAPREQAPCCAFPLFCAAPCRADSCLINLSGLQFSSFPVDAPRDH